MQVLRFASAGRTLSAVGRVSATLTDNHGASRTIHTTVALAASTGGGCKVLHLDLKELTLQLLGLNAHLDRVLLDITGDAKGAHQGQVLRFSALLTPRATTSATGTCPVLDLVVGPLNLQLLGLVVDLQRVHLSVTATRGGGALGDLFCTLADNSTTTTTAATTT